MGNMLLYGGAARGVGGPGGPGAADVVRSPALAARLPLRGCGVLSGKALAARVTGTPARSTGSPTGLAGSTGLTGSTGFTGSTGSTGLAGATGGAYGYTGSPTGSTGSTGNADAHLFLRF